MVTHIHTHTHTHIHTRQLRCAHAHRGLIMAQQSHPAMIWERPPPCLPVYQVGLDGLCIALIRPNHWAASVSQWLEHLSSKQCVVGSNPTRAALFSFAFFFSEKKELFGLVASPFFLFIEKSFHVIDYI